jgi:hypothetical protein
MNVVFISPHFPPQYFHFATALKEQGVSVLGLGDAPFDALRPELRGALREYYYAPHLGDVPALQRAVGYFTWRHGRIDRIESLNETWLGVEAHLREDFNVSGLRPADIARLRSKLGMAGVFREAGVPHPDCEPVRDARGVKAFAKQVGYPLVLKPDVGVGAARTFKVGSDAEVEVALASPLPDYVVQAFVQGTIVTYDGLVDRDGDIVFRMSHEYSEGVMEVVNEKRDIAFWSLREVPAALEALGRQTVAAFRLRERWFHLEFFRLADGRFVSLEANLRPPGGFITDMMNFACDIDVYQLWARHVAGASVKDFRYSLKYHVCHTSRRAGRAYRHGHSEVVQHLGPALLWHQELPAVYHSAMGSEMYLARHTDEREMREAIRFIQERA